MIEIPHQLTGLVFYRLHCASYAWDIIGNCQNQAEKRSNCQISRNIMHEERVVVGNGCIS